MIVVGDMLELGGQSERLHRQVGQRAAQTAPARLYAYGKFAEAVSDGAQSAGMAPARIFIGDKAAIAADLIARLSAGDWVLIKGSRGMAMETVVEAVRAWADSPPPA